MPGLRTRRDEDVGKNISATFIDLRGTDNSQTCSVDLHARVLEVPTLDQETHWIRGASGPPTGWIDFEDFGRLGTNRKS